MHAEFDPGIQSILREVQAHYGDEPQKRIEGALRSVELQTLGSLGAYLKGIEVELAEGWLTNAPWGLERSHAESVYNVATNAAGNLASLPLPPLVDLLGRGTEDAKCAAARAIKNLAPDSRAAIAQAGAIPPLVGLLQSGSASVTEQAVSAVHNLTIGSEQVCLAIAQAGAIPPLVGLLQSGSASVAERALRVIRNLIIGSEPRKAAIAQAGAIPPLVGLLQSGSASVAEKAVVAIGNLASGSEPRKAAIAQAGAIPPLVGLLQSGSASVAEQAVSAIGNLASGSEPRKAAIAQAGAIPPLVGLLQSGSASVAEKAVSAIRNLTSGSEPRRAVIAQAGAIPPLVGLLQSGSASVAEQALRVIRKLAADSETRKAAIAEAAHCAGAIPLLGGLLYAEEEEEGVEAGETSSRPTTNDPIKVLRGEHEGRYARISTDRQGSKPYKVRFYDGLVSGWLAERDVEKVSEQEKTHEQSREKGAAGEDDGKGRTAGPAVASLGVTPSYWVGKYAGQHGFALFHINPNSSLRLWSALEKIMCVPDPHNLGVGQDASGGDYTQLELRRAWRVEHPANWMQYTAAKVEVQSQMQRCNTSRLRSLKTALQKAYAAVPEMACDAGINEVFLLHGTKPEILYDVLSNGLVEGFSGGLFGQGNYLAENPCKNDQYVEVDEGHARSGNLKKLHDMLYRGQSHPRDVYYLLLCRVAMGFYVCTKDAETIHSSGESLWMNEERVLAQIPGTSFIHHSLLAETGDVIKRHREFIVFKGTRIYPEYILAYTRK